MVRPQILGLERAIRGHPASLGQDRADACKPTILVANPSTGCRPSAPRAEGCYRRRDCKREARMWVRNAWYVAAWTHDLEPGRIVARTIIDQPLALYRTGDDTIVA